VAGPAADRDLDGARQMVRDGILCSGAVRAFERGRFRLAIEPLHRMFAERPLAWWSRWGGQALWLLQLDRPPLGWRWTCTTCGGIPRSTPRLRALLGQIGFHVSDWLVPPPDTSRAGVMGDGIIELRRLREAVEGRGGTWGRSK